ncbi:permease prefix domain 1-containing protein [Metasolibacillus meyeri]|uniref:permease prefix domain 1-containing protein n=1 Tax=Metasolibacillus meyeri TaxID=1071052 RepID=UPI000D3172B6|nr:permease prefix domain 1-containing protein [Metasolibacillus meyeri]
MSSIENYIDLVLQRVEVKKVEYLGLKSELTSYLNERKETYIEKGYTATEAVEKTLRDFGNVDLVGKALAKSLFPQRTIAMYWLVGVSTIFSLLLTLLVFIRDMNIPYLWLITLGIMSSITITLTKRQLLIARYRMLFIGFCFIYILSWFYGILLMDIVETQIMSWVLRILAFLFIIAIIINIVIGAIYQPIKKHFSSLQIKKRVLLVICNTISGIVVLGYTFLTLIGFVIFGAADPFLLLSPVLTATVLWLCSLLISSYRPSLVIWSIGIQVVVCVLIYLYTFEIFNW